MTWGVEDHVIERFGAAGVAREDVHFLRDTYTFRFEGTTAQFADTFRRYYGPTMNAFEAAEKAGRAGELREELEALVERCNQSESPERTVIPAAFLRVTVQVR